MHVSSEISSVAQHSPHIKVFVVYCLILELFVDKFNFFKFLSMSDKPPGPTKNYYWYLYIVQASLNCFICTRMEKYLSAKISYSIASLVFCKFPCVTYQNGINRDTSRLRHSRYLKEYEGCQLNIFCWESAG